ncbi:MAG: sulfotransferase [Thiotrichaceae bacterium]
MTFYTTNDNPYIPITRAPIFILGNNRSGTTLVRMMITSHPDIIIPPESHFFLWLYDQYKDWKPEHDLNVFIKDLFGCTKIETWGMREELLSEFIRVRSPSCYRDLVSLVYRYYGVVVGKEAKRWGDKNSLWPNRLGVVDIVFPQAVFLHIVRDGRDVACSYLDLGKREFQSKYAPRLPQDIQEIARIWSRNVRTVRNFGNKLYAHRYYEFRYEDLIENPEQEMKLIFEFLHMEYHPDVLQYATITKNKNYEPSEFLAWKEKVYQPIDKNNKGKYTRLLSIHEVKAFERIANRELSYYGYI